MRPKGSFMNFVTDGIGSLGTLLGSNDTVMRQLAMENLANFSKRFIGSVPAFDDPSDFDGFDLRSLVIGYLQKMEAAVQAEDFQSAKRIGHEAHEELNSIRSSIDRGDDWSVTNEMILKAKEQLEIA